MAVVALFLGMPAGWAAAPAGEGAPAAMASAVLLGTVRDSAGAPVAGARVRMRSYHTAGGWLDGTTDAQGRFRLEGLEPGDFLVWVELGPLISTDGQVIAVAAGDNRHDLPCPRREIRGRVLSAAGRPVAGARVVLARSRGPSATLKTNPEGRFAFLLLDGWYSLFVDAPGFRPHEGSSPLRVHGTSRTEEIRMQPAASTSGRETAITGRVTGLLPAEMADAEVLAYPPGSDGYTRASALDSTGRYRIEDIELPGQWGLIVETRSRKIQRLVNVPPDHAGRDVGAVDLAFPECFAVSGRVLNADASTGDFDQLAFDDPRQAGSQSTRVGPRGSFSIALPSGTFHVAAAHSGDASPDILARVPLVVDGKPLQGVEIRLDATGIIAGRILGAGPGARMEDLTVRAFQGHLAKDGEVDDLGQYEIDGLPPGPWEVTAWSGVGDIASARVRLPEDASRASLDLSFRPGPLTLSGRLAGFDPAATYLVRILREDSRDATHLFAVEHDGTFSRSGLAAGTYRVEVEDSAMAWPLYAGTVDLRSDRSLVLNLSLPP
jgi:Carboxypeptidase regulatory-like domain